MNSARPRSVAKPRDSLLCLNCTNRTLADERAEREKQMKQSALATEQKVLVESIEQLRRERELLSLRKRERAEDLQSYMQSAAQSRTNFHRDTATATSIPLPEPSKDFLQEQRRYREALLQQISQERVRKAEVAADERKWERESVQRVQQQHSLTVSTSTSLIQSQQSDLRKSLLAQMREKERQREQERSRKTAELQYLKREEARYQEIQRQRLESRKQQTQAMAAVLASQTKVAKPQAETTATSLKMPEKGPELYPCSKCNRLLARSVLSRPAWT